MLRTLQGVVSSLLLILMLGIGATPAEAVTASKQKGLIQPGLSFLCEKDDPICMIGSASTSNITPKRLIAHAENPSVNMLASPIKPLELSIDSGTKPAKDICSINSAPTPTPEKPEAQIVSSVSYFASPSSALTPITQTVSPTPTIMVAADSEVGLNADTLFSLVNAKRAEAGLAPLEKNPAVCEVAYARAPEMQSNVASGNMHAGFYARKPDYQSTENMIYMRTEEEALNWWLNSPVHRSSIYGDYQHSCLVCEGNTCAQIFANVTPPSPTPAIQ